MVGPRLERYEILEELGQGGMSVVYRARDRQLPREVAIKVLHDFLAKQPDARQRFHREAVAVAKLRHPGIVEIFDYSGPEREEAFIVTELIHGPTLRDLIERNGRLPHPELAMLLTLEIARALKHAHDQGVVHRDLKPENVMVTRDGTLKLMDFGIAQIQDGPRVTMTGTLLGSPAHMAPEVIDGARPDARADLFSLGTILYWLATSRLPFDEAHPSALFRKILEGQYEDPQQVEPKIGNGLLRIIRHLLERDPAARYQDAAELLEDLSRELDEVGLTPPEPAVRELLGDPGGYAERLRPVLVARLIASGRAALGDRNLGRAMDRFNRVLAIEPEHAEVRGLVRRVSRRVDLGRRLRRVAVALALLVTLVASATVARPYLLPEPAEVAPPSLLLATDPTASPILDPPPTAPPAVADPAALAPRGSATTAVLLPTGSRTSPAAGTKTHSHGSNPSGVNEGSAGTARTDAGTAAIEPDAGAPAPTLSFRIGRSWANIKLDGRVIERGVYSGTIPLPPGRHTLEVERPPLGAFRPKVLEVDAQGQILEIQSDGSLRPLRGELSFPIPEPGQGDAHPDWIPQRVF